MLDYFKRSSNTEGSNEGKSMDKTTPWTLKLQHMENK